MSSQGRPATSRISTFISPGIGAEQVGQSDGGEKRRRKVGQRGGELDQRLCRDVGARTAQASESPMTRLNSPVQAPRISEFLSALT